MSTPVHDPIRESPLGQVLAKVFDGAWYGGRYPDVMRTGIDPLRHFILHGAAEGRDPNRWFDSTWYRAQYADVAASGMNPLLHYLQSGAAERRNPHPRFDAVWYVNQHPEAASNPLVFHLHVGAARGWGTEKPIVIADYLPSTAAPLVCPEGRGVDVVIPVYRDLAVTRRCLESVLADPDGLAGRIIVVDDCSPEPALSAWLASVAKAGRITLLRNRKNLGFVASVNAGMRAAGTHDVVLLNSDTEVPPGWLRRLTAQAYQDELIATVSPLSNNATICGYPRDQGGPIPFGASLAEVDGACRRVNAGRFVDLPTTVGFCMYIRRAALDAVGGFDEAAFGRGYGEENDFCLRASALGWRHRLACDVFVYHAGAVSFGSDATALQCDAMAVLMQRYPSYGAAVAHHVALDAVGPYRLAVTAGLFAGSGLPVILMVSHDLGGGVLHHIDSLVERTAGRAHVLLLRSTARGPCLSVPAVPGHATLTLPADRLEDLVRYLRSAGIRRVHVHHVAGMDLDIQALLHRLAVPFDVTVHDYFAICPQVTLLPWPDGLSCGEPGPATCNACIASRPSHASADILSWRLTHAWMFREADRVLCPSNDTRDRLARFGLAARAVVAPHDPVPSAPWPCRMSRRPAGRLRIALIGTLADHKGAAIVAAVAAAAPAAYAFHLIGSIDGDATRPGLDRLHVSGRYDPADLPDRLRKLDPHLIWFPGAVPETYSYTLSTAIESGLPIVVSDIGSFTERLTGRPLTWMIEPTLDTRPWLAAFEAVQATTRVPRMVRRRTKVTDFYGESYLVPSPKRGCDGLIDVRRPGRVAVVVVPERYESGALTPCAYIRLLLPLTHPSLAEDLEIVLADARSALRYRADVIVTQRHAVVDTAAADALTAHAKETGAALVYDLDDDLLHIPRSHPDADVLRPKGAVVRRLLRQADQVFVSTDALAAAVGSKAAVMANGLDEQIWGGVPALPRRPGPVRLLCMGTATHDADFAMIEPALARIVADFGPRVSVEMLGFSSSGALPEWVKRVVMPPSGGASYPGFVHWVSRDGGWDVGLAPLEDTAFNRCKSPIKTLDYAAIGLPVLASDGPVYRGSLADGVGGMLVQNTTEAWYGAISRMIRDGAWRARLAEGARAHVEAHGTLAAQAAARRAAWLAVAGKGG